MGGINGAKDVALEIMHEDEVGNTMLCEMLDEAMQAAMDDGSTALGYPKTKRVATLSNEHKLSHGGTATWHNENLLVERTAPTAVGSGDLLGHDLTDEMKESLANGHSVKLKSGLVMYPPNYKSDLPRPHLQTWIESSDSKPKIAD